MEPAVDVRFIVPVPLTFSPEKLPVVMLPDDRRLIELVAAAVPTAPPRESVPVVAVSSIVVPPMVTPLEEFKLPWAVTLKSLPAPELLLIVLVPASGSLM